MTRTPDDYRLQGIEELRQCLAAAHAEVSQAIEWAHATRGVDDGVTAHAIEARRALHEAIQKMPKGTADAES